MYNLKLITALLLSGIIIMGFTPINASNDTQELKNIKRISSKIHPIILQWQSSPNPDESAIENNLILRDGKISVYIYLNDSKAISEISDIVDVISSDGNTAVAFVDSKMIGLLENSQFVKQITIPDIARNPPIPQVEPLENVQNSSEDYTLIGLISIIAIISVIIFYKKFKNK